MRNLTVHFATAVLLTSVATMGQASSIFVPKDTVVPVIVENELTLGRARIGDRFTAHAEGDRDLPYHTRLIGRVMRIESAREDRPAYAELEFTDVILPDGSRHEVHGLPVAIDDKYTTRRDDGRIVLKDDSKKREGYVIGGAVGGFILGSIVHKQRDATLLGTLAGVIASQVDRKNDGYTIFRKGDRIGMLVNQDVSFETYGRGKNPDRRDSGRADDFPRGTGRPGDLRGQDDAPVAPRRPDDSRPIDRGVPPRSDSRGPSIAFDGRDLTFTGDAKPYREGSTVMIPVEAAVKQLGLSFERGKTTAVYVDGAKASLRLEQDSKEARLNGQSVDLSSAVVEKNGVIYAPVEILASVKKGILVVDGNRIEQKTY